jgi:hypothetical protein
MLTRASALHQFCAGVLISVRQYRLGESWSEVERRATDHTHAQLHLPGVNHVICGAVLFRPARVVIRMPVAFPDALNGRSVKEDTILQTGDQREQIRLSIR